MGDWNPLSRRPLKQFNNSLEQLQKSRNTCNCTINFILKRSSCATCSKNQISNISARCFFIEVYVIPVKIQSSVKSWDQPNVCMNFNPLICICFCEVRAITIGRHLLVTFFMSGHEMFVFTNIYLTCIFLLIECGCSIKETFL